MHQEEDKIPCRHDTNSCQYHLLASKNTHDQYVRITALQFRIETEILSYSGKNK